MIENRAEKALFLIREGYTAQEIVKMCNYANISCVFNLAKSHGLKVTKAHDGLHEQMRQYKAEGHTMGEVAEKFGVCEGTAQLICKGINPQKATPPRSEPHPCPVCGEITDKPKYCSDACRKKAGYINQNTRRRLKLQNALVDDDITLRGLFIRDSGRCYICGEQCDWEDHGYNGNHFIAGHYYPTIDHVVPLSKGGEHSWSNVKLAHFSCNSAKGARICG
jgi:predicted nucleic acid-binding Zn ribbon protein